MSQNEDHINKGAEDPSRTLDAGQPLYEIGSRIGGYKLLSVLGEGGFGIVYLAEQQGLVKRRVALKVIKPGMDTKQVIARFEAERQALALLDHPNIAQVYDAGTTEAGRPYFVMEYVKGVPITEHCDRCKARVEDRLQLFLHLCAAVQHAHQKGIIHRDIKPSNIIVALEGNAAVAKIIDFGVAKALSQPLTERTLVTEHGQMLGTPEYMSPEQAEMTAQDIDTRSDIYSLGVLLYELLTGTLPFDPKELREGGLDHMRHVIREQEPKTPSTRLSRLSLDESVKLAQCRRADPASLCRRLRGDLDWITLKAMDKDRTRRYQTAHALAEDIERHLNNEPVLAGRPGTLYRFQKLIRRNKGVFAAVAVVAVVLVLGASVSTWQAALAKRAERREARLRQEAQANELAMRRLAYASDMSLAQQALSQNNLGRAQDLLNRHRPKLEARDLRGWEWRYLWQQGRSDASSTLCQQSSQIWSLAVSPGGKWLAVGEYENGGLSVWDLAASQQIARLEAGDGPVRVAFSPTEELMAFSAVTGSGSTNPQHHIRLWNGTTQQIGTPLPLGGECVGLAFSDGGRRLITYAANPENQVTCWGVPEGTKLASHPVSAFDITGTPGTPFAVARDGTVAAAAPDNTIHLIDLSERKTRWKEKAADEIVKALAFSPDGRFLASGAGFVESAIRLWNVATGKEITRLEGHRAWVSALMFWPDSKTLASASGDQTIRLWDLSDVNNVPPPRVLRGHKLEVWRLALLPDGKTLVSGCKDGSVYRWDTTAIQHERTRVILPATVVAWRFAPDGQSVLTVDVQGLAVRWKGRYFQERELLLDLGLRFGPSMWPFSYSPLVSREGRRVAAGSADGTIKVWDLPTRKLLHEFTPSKEWVVPLEFTERDKRLVVFHVNDGTYHEWDLASWQQTRFWQGLVQPPVATAFSADERLCVMFAYGGGNRLRDIVTGQESNHTLDVRDVFVVAFSPDARLFAAASARGYAKLWETATFRELPEFRGFLMGVHSVAFSPDGKRLAAGSDGSEAVKLWDVESYQEVLTLEGQGSLFVSSAFSPDGDVVGSLNGRSELHLWRAPSWAEIEAEEKKQNGPLP